MSNLKKVIISIIIVSIILPFIVIIPETYAIEGLGDLNNYKGTDIGSQKLEAKAEVVIRDN